MPNKNYRRGYSQEKRCLTDLKAVGYWVERFYASKGTFDVIAVDGGLTRLIQVKSSKQYIVAVKSIENAYQKDIALMREVKSMYTGAENSVSVELWVWFAADYIRKPAKKAGWRKFDVYPDHLEESGDCII